LHEFSQLRSTSHTPHTSRGDRQTTNELLRERRSLTPSMALRLGRLFGNSPEFWMNAQREVDLWEARQELQKELQKICPLGVA
jgi:plasmid maintenance system antidote protein VapI